MPQVGQSTAMQQDGFIASQIAEFANDKTLYHNFLEEVLDPKLLVQQSPQESFALVQIIFKAGLQLLDQTDNVDTSEYESLFIRSLKSVCIVLVEHREILLMPLQSGAVSPDEMLWSWLLARLLDLLQRPLSSSLHRELSSAIHTLVQQLRLATHEGSIFDEAIYRLTDVIRDLSEDLKHFHSSDTDGRDSSNALKNKISLILRLYAVLFGLISIENDLECEAKPPRLSSDLRKGLMHFLNSSRIVLDKIDVSCLFLLMTILAASSMRLAAARWQKEAIQMLESLAHLSTSELNTDDSLHLHNQKTQIDADLLKILHKLNRASLEPNVARNFALAAKSLLDNPPIVLTSTASDLLVHITKSISSEKELSQGASRRLAPIFHKRVVQPTKRHPLAFALSEVNVLPDTYTHVLFHLNSLHDFDMLNTFQQACSIHAFGLAACGAAGTLSPSIVPNKSGLSFTCDNCDNVRSAEGQKIPIDPSDHDPKRIFLLFAKSQAFREQVSIRVNLMKSWKRWLHHTQDSKILDLKDTSILRYINGCLEDESRQVRILAG